MKQPFMYKIYKKHSRIIKKLLAIFVWSKSAQIKIRTMLSYPDGIRKFKIQEKKLKEENNKHKKFKNFVSIVAIVRNEALNFPEWIEYHRIVGVDKFYIYDNGSTDDTHKVLQPYIDSGVVEYIYFPGEKMQIAAYNHFIEHFKNETKWAATIDLDEFIVSKKSTLLKFLDDQKANIAQILVPWVFFGSNGHIKHPSGLVIENYTKRASRAKMYKSIFNPRLVISANVHKHVVVDKTIKPKMTEIMINHYYCKSWSDYSKRATRGDACYGKDYATKTFTKAKFDSMDTNDVYDPFILQFVPDVKKRLGK